MTSSAALPGILHSRLAAQECSNDQLVPEHTLGHLVAGEIRFQTPQGPVVFRQGSTWLVRRHQLAKGVKVPPAGGGQFKFISIFLSQDLLRQYSLAQNVAATGPYQGLGMREFPADPFLRGYFDSLLPYFTAPAGLTAPLMTLKVQEAIALLLRLDPKLKNWLFDFQEVHKSDLVAFMHQHYMYNLVLPQFARLTGRSLATFKRDFQKLFGQAPHQWLTHKRLDQAHALLTQRQRPTEVYLEVGFENLSHFSTAFKQRFGYTASSLAASTQRRGRASGRS